ncbi:MAG: ribonuclease J [Alphaproteobacteria bacterium]|nr:ribonuclease J [Rhodospirillales bacterium]MCW9046067.1 ribonuclease J [Alphaproteobacteria bacterium]
MTKQQKELLYLPLGGAGEIGMNFYLYGYGKPGEQEWIIVDCGITFGDDTAPGVDVLMADPEFIAQNRHALAGIVLTHAHEDHVGAIPYLWEQLQCPIYATPFTASFLRRKLDETTFKRAARITEVDLGGTVKVGPFDIEYVSMTHSIVEPNALVLRTPLGTVVHSGDFKFDPAPVIGDVANEKRLEEIGDEGVLALVCDSTNVFSPGTSKSEGALLEPMTEVIGRFKNKVALACFASNVARLETIARAAHANGRAVAIVGRSLRRIEEVARENGYLKDIPNFIDEKDMSFIPDDKILMICTGSQGEPRAALARIVAGDHPHVNLGEGDAVIFSSRVIPGNERSIGRLQNALVRNGVSIITDRDAFIHVSGHPAQEELELMYDLVRPEIAVPMHGELRHLNANAELAVECEVDEAVVIENGEMLRLAPGPATIVDTVHTGRIVFEGNRLVDLNSLIQRSRTRVLYNGSAVVSIVIDQKGLLIAEPQITTQGLVLDEGDEDLMDDVVDAIHGALTKMDRASKKDDQAVNEAVRIGTRRCFKKLLNKRPIVDVHVIRV